MTMLMLNMADNQHGTYNSNNNNDSNDNDNNNYNYRTTTNTTENVQLNSGHQELLFNDAWLNSLHPQASEEEVDMLISDLFHPASSSSSSSSSLLLLPVPAPAPAPAPVQTLETKQQHFQHPPLAPINNQQQMFKTESATHMYGVYQQQQQQQNPSPLLPSFSSSSSSSSSSAPATSCIKREPGLESPFSSEDDCSDAESIYPSSPGTDSSTRVSSTSTSATFKCKGKRRTFTKEEDELLVSLVSKFGANRWSRLATYFPNKEGNQLSQRWHKALDPSIKRGKWSKEEDEAVVAAVASLGRKWKAISKIVTGRTGKQIRDRYISCLDPKLQTGKFTEEEDKLLLEAYAKYGNKWASIAKVLPHRSWFKSKWRIECLLKKQKKYYSE